LAQYLADNRSLKSPSQLGLRSDGAQDPQDVLGAAENETLRKLMDDLKAFWNFDLQICIKKM
jgi:hypothetical protein